MFGIWVGDDVEVVGQGHDLVEDRVGQAGEVEGRDREEDRRGLAGDPAEAQDRPGQDAGDGIGQDGVPDGLPAGRAQREADLPVGARAPPAGPPGWW